MVSIEPKVCGCGYPLFRATFLERAACNEESGEKALPSTSQGPPELGQSSRGLASLDIRALRDARGDGPPSELQARREKYAFFEKHCSEVAEGLFLGSDVVARNRDTLRAAGVTHVINCVGFLYPAYFKDELTYLTLYLQDTPTEDIVTVLYDVFEFIEAARSSGGRVLLHCSQGVSRSASLAIGYLMWRRGGSFDEVLASVKAIRGVANPNIGFTCQEELVRFCIDMFHQQLHHSPLVRGLKVPNAATAQLLNWHKRRTGGERASVMYRIAPQCTSAPMYLVPKAVPAPSLDALDSRGAFVVQTADQTIIWQGNKCHPLFEEAAQRAAALLAKYEGAHTPAIVVREGAACAALHCWAGPPEDVRDADAPILARELEAYDRDFRVFLLEAENGGSSGGSSSRTMSSAAPSTARGSEGGGLSARAPKTPRDKSDDCGGSPNQRSRKMRKADNAEIEVVD